MLQEWRTRTWLRLKALAKRKQFESDLDEELRFHIARREEKLVSGGASHEEARDAARRHFGNSTSIREVTREMWTFTLLANLWQDVRFAMRMLAKRPGFAAALVLVLALGIGGTSAIFTIVDGVLLEPLPYKNPSQLVTVGGAGTPPYGDRLKYWGQGRAFSDVAACESGGLNFADAGRSERIPAATVSASFFPLFGVNPELGRGFVAEDEAPGRNHLVLLSHRFWMREYEGDRSALGKTVALNGELHTIVGVMPPGFGFPGHTDVWTPRIANREQQADNQLYLGSDKQADAPFGCGFLARLRDGVTVADAQGEMKGLLQRFNTTFYPGQKNMAVGMILVHPLQQLLVRNSAIGLWVLLGAVAFFLVIACVNVAHMLLVRAATRQKEVAVRLCLGASRGRVLRQILTENLLLAIISGVAGTLLAYWSLRLIQLVGPKDVPRLADIRLDLRALCFALGLSLIVGLLVGFAPALQTISQDLTRALKTESSRPTGALRKRLRGAMIVAEVALTLVLLMGAGVMIRSLDNLLRVQPGFTTKNVITIDFSLPQAKYSPSESEQSDKKPSKANAKSKSRVAGGLQQQESRVSAFYRQLSSVIDSLPGVISVSEVDRLPLGGKGGMGLYLVAGSCNGIFHQMNVAAGYFDAMSIPVLAGRVYAPEDTGDPENGIVISQAMARTCWPGESALGKSVKLERSGPDDPSRQVIGIVGNVKFSGLGDEDLYYAPQGQEPGSMYYLPAEPMDATLIVRGETDPRLLVPAIRERAKTLDPDVPLFNVRTMTEVVADSTSTPRFRGVVVGIFAALALVLAVFGLYSVVAYSVTCRTHEMGVRMALGAQPRDILMMVTREGMWLAFAGVALGAVGSYSVNSLIASLLYGVKPMDPATLVASAALLAAGTVTACMLPARHASRTDPSEALRYE